MSLVRAAPLGRCRKISRPTIWKASPGERLGSRLATRGRVRVGGEEDDVQRAFVGAGCEEWVVRRHVLDFVGGADHDGGVELELLADSAGYEVGDALRDRAGREEDDVAALDVGPHADAAGPGEDAGEMGHRQLVLAADVDSAKQGHVGERLARGR